MVACNPFSATLEMTPQPNNLAPKAVVLDTWAERRYYAVDVVGETPKKARDPDRNLLRHGAISATGHYTV